jgi:phosphatidylinositol-3-phosphatase
VRVDVRCQHLGTDVMPPGPVQPGEDTVIQQALCAYRLPSAVALFLAACLLATLGLAGSAAGSAGHAAPAARASALSKIRHVWIIELENTSYPGSFGHPSADPYLARTLVSKGALLEGYYGIGHDSLDNYIAEISGQAPNFQTGQDCEYFSPFLQFGGETFDKWTKYNQLSGDGCVYPRYVATVASQLSARHLTWKSYNQDMGNDPRRDGTTATAHGPACGHPKLGTIDQTDVTGPANDSYATRHNPFVYFKAVIGNQAYCDAHVVTLNPLRHDLSAVAVTPSYSWITPNTCFDGHDVPLCQNGTKGGLGRVDEFLSAWVPRIMASPAYKKNGLIVITFDESGNDQNARACCGEKDSLGYDDPSHPNANEPGLWGPGGGRVGAVALSPFIKPGTWSAVTYNHYSLLKTVERIFGLPLLGDATQPQVRAFGADVFTR